jgi:Zn-dependent protease with chaperone function
MADLASGPLLGVLWLLLALAASLLAAAGRPVLGRLLRDADASDRARACLAYGLLPPLAATLAVLLSWLPDASTWLVPHHCHGNDCTPHAPQVALASAAGALIASVGAALVAIVIGAGWRALSRMQRRLRALDLLANPDRGHGYAVMETARPLAWCAGLLRPRVFVSRGLLDRLTEDETAAVLAHERTHAERRDNLRMTALRYATLLWPRGARRRLLDDLSLSTEEVCDRAAAQTLGSPAALARLLELLGGADAAGPGQPRLAFGSTAIAARIRALRSDAGTERPALPAWLWLAGLWSVLVVTLTPLGHRSIEWLTAV